MQTCYLDQWRPLTLAATLLCLGMDAAFAESPQPRQLAPIAAPSGRADAAAPRPLNLDDYRFASAMRNRVLPAAKSDRSEPLVADAIVPRAIPLVPGQRSGRALRPSEASPLASITPIEDSTDKSRASAIAAPEIAIEPNVRVSVPDLQPKTIAFAARTPQASSVEARILTMPPRAEVVSVMAEPAARSQPAPGVQVGDAVSAAPPCCSEHGELPEGCPYYPWQSGTRSICGVDCSPYGAPCCEGWEHAHLIPWSVLGPGEYVGPPRPEHVPAYYLRVNDLLTLTYIVSRQKQADPYRIGIGDQLRVESSIDESLDREIYVQPDGNINLPLIGDVPAAGKTIKEFREEVVNRYSRLEREPLITITPLQFNTGLQEILNAVTSQSRLSGQAIDLRVTPEGTIQAPGLGSVYVQGLAIEELRSELEARYASVFGPGLLISPALTERATSYVFIGGEVVTPGRYTLEGPTTVMQAIALAGGWNNGGNTREVVVFRRDENWCLKATKINVHRPLYGKDPCPVNDVWLRDNDLVIVPKTKILCAADVIELYFTRGVYAVFPITYVKDFSRGTTMAVPIGP